MAVSEFVVVYTTTSTKEQANKLALLITESRLAACVSVISDIQSYYYWQGQLEQAQEYQLMIKTHSLVVDKLNQLIHEHHEYKVPEIIVLPIMSGSEAYLTWLKDQVAFSQ